MIYTYRYFISIFLQMNTWWYIHTLTLYQFSCRWTPDDIYMSQLYFNFPADEHLVIYTYRNFISIFLQINTWWYIHVVTFFNFPADKRLIIYNTPTLYEIFCRWTPDDIYIPQLYINFPADNYLMIYIYRNFISIFLQMNS